MFETPFARYTATEMIGSGGCGVVFAVRDEAGAEFAVKVLANGVSTQKVKRFKNELFFCLRHPHRRIVAVVDYGIAHDDGDATPFYVMPRYEATLGDLIAAGIRPVDVLPLFAQILDGVEAGHLRNVIHRDLKPTNILYDPATGETVVADWGAAHFTEDQLCTTVETGSRERVANMAYAAPEQRRPGSPLDHRADLYALGLILNEMFTREIPHGTRYRTITSVAPEFDYLDTVVELLMRQAPSERPESVDTLKQLISTRQTVALSRQRLSALTGAVIDASEIDDPLVRNPVRLINVDYLRGTLQLKLSQHVNAAWIREFQTVPYAMSVAGRGPETFTFSGDIAGVQVPESKAQAAIDDFKVWVRKANERYAEALTRVIAQAEQQHRERLRREVEAEERRQRLLSSIRI